MNIRNEIKATHARRLFMEINDFYFRPISLANNKKKSMQQQLLFQELSGADKRKGIEWCDGRIIFRE